MARTPISTLPARPRVRRTRRTLATAAAPGALTLVAASYVAGTHVDLTFGRAVDIAGIEPAAIRVYDGDEENVYVGAPGGATLTGPATVRVALSFADNWDEPGVTLSTDGPTGIVAAGDGASWAGATDLALPFP